MSATTVTSPRGTVAPPRRSLGSALADAWAITGRNVIVYRRVPTLVVFTLIQPVVFVLLFRYVFGGAIRVPGGIPYVDYLMPGIFVQTVAFGATNTAIGLATDVKSGLLERFHSLPMARSAVLTGRTFADLGRNVLVVAIMAIVGFAVGFRVQTNVAGFVAGVLLVLLFAYAFSWVFATVGLAIGDPESAQAATFPVLAPIVFASSVFVPVSTMPSWLRGWATYQPVSVTANAARALMLGGPTLSWVLQSVGWCAAIVAICAPPRPAPRRSPRPAFVAPFRAA